MKSKRVPQESDARDIGERARLEQALRASEERFRTLVQLSFDVYWESDAEHRFTRQDFAPTLLNAPAPGSELGKTRWEVPYLEPDEEAWRQHRATLDAHEPFRDFELARQTAAGGKRHVSVSGFPVFDEQGRFAGYRGVGRDITERKRAEAQQQAHVWFLQSIDRINRALHGSQDLERMIADVLETTLEVFACDRAWLVQPCDPEGATWRAVMECTRPPLGAAFAAWTDVATDADMAAVYTAARSSTQPVLALPAPLADRLGIRSQIAMAFRPKGDEPYLLGLHQASQARAWTADEQRLFQEIGGRLADTLSNLRAIRSLRESERRLEAAQRVAHVGWWERDFRSTRVSLSDEASRIFGVEPVDLPHWHGRWLSLIHPDDRAEAAAASEAALRGGPRYDVDYRVVRPDGTIRMVHSQGDVTWDESGRPVRQFGVMQDITELWRAEEELRASEARFRTFVDRATDAFFLHGSDLRLVDVNRQACESLGRSREELIGMHPRDFDVTLDEAGMEKLRARTAEGGAVTFETSQRRKDGSIFPVEVRTGAFRRDGTLYYLALARDITERKRAEEDLRASEARFRTFVDRATDAFFLLDEQLRVVDVNRQACEALGYRREELIGMYPSQFDAALDEPSIELLGERARSGGTITFETRHRRRDGTVFPVEIRSGTFRQGDRLYYLALARDITERKRAEESLREKDDALQTTRAELAHVSRLTTLGELTSSIAHEVSQPLGGMIASAGACARWLAADPPDIAEARAALDHIAADGKRARDVIARIRALTKRQPARNDRLDINHEIREVLALTERESRRHDIVVRTRLDGTLPRVAGDRVQLQQVLLNLVINAIEAMSTVRDRPRLLTIVSGHDSGNGVLVELCDSGIGLDPEVAERMFEAFYTTKADGIGIGLSISRSIVEAHGGRLSASPNEPHGAVFRLSLPVAGKGQP
jgi:PAS domain S-box-containing protein